MTLTSVIGNQRSGKNTFLSRIGLKSNKTNRKPIWSNFILELDTYNELEIVDLLYLEPNVIVFIDEAYAWLESRRSSSNINKFITNIIFQCAKRRIDMYASAQMYSSVDIRFRDQADYVVECQDRDEYDDFVYKISMRGVRNTNTYTLSYERANKAYFPLFDTYEIINSHNIENLEFELLKTYPEKLNSKVDSIVKYIKPKLEKITHDSIKDILLREGIVLGFEKFVYSRLKGST